MKEKIKTWKEIQEIVDSIRDEKIIVTSNGSFDVFHVGHLKSLQQAKSLGDVLIVCLNSDNSIKEYKSKDRPINPQEARAELLAGLECVDYVVIFEQTNPCKLFEIIKPHKHVKSKSGFTGVERETVESNGGEIILVDDAEGYSTTKILEKLKNSK